MPKIEIVTQLVLENFGELVQSAEEGGADLEPLSAQEIQERSLAARVAFEERNPSIAPIDNAQGSAQDEEVDYREPYRRLINAGIAWRIAAFVAWATMPKQHRWPRTQEELATEVLGLTSDRQISRWRRKYPEIDQMIADLQAEALLKFRPGAFEAMGKVVSKDTYRATQERRLFFEMTGDYTPRQQIDVGKSAKDGNVGGMSDEELRKHAGWPVVDEQGSEGDDVDGDPSTAASTSSGQAPSDPSIHPSPEAQGTQGADGFAQGDPYSHADAGGDATAHGAIIDPTDVDNRDEDDAHSDA